MKSLPVYHLRDFVPADQFFHIARVPVRGANIPVVVHSHDFAELFWVESGRGIHVINGKRLPLEAGDLVMIRAPDRHGFDAPRDGEGFTMVNVAFETEVLRFLRRRYFDGRLFPWTGRALPSQFAVGAMELTRLHKWSDELAARLQSRLGLECFLADVLRMVSSPPAQGIRANDPGRPEWLERALTTFASPEHFSHGAAELSKLAERCPEHLNRVVRRCFKKTTTDLVNDIRLDYVARQLRMTNRSITNLSLDCGITNLGYFYRLFGKRFGRTPRRYRLEKRAVVG